jgi:hypothetical protein
MSCSKENSGAKWHGVEPPGTRLGREELRLLPSGEVATLVDLVGGDGHAPISTLRDVVVIARALHQRVPGARDPIGIPAGRLRLRREAVAGSDGMTRWNASSSLSGQRVAATRRRRSSRASSGISTWTGRIAMAAAGLSVVTDMCAS